VKKNWIYLKRGLLTPEHVRRMGVRLWLYLYMCDGADWPTGVYEDWKDRFAADDLGMPEATIRDQRARLSLDGYVTCKQTQHGLRVTILKWVNPRSYDGKVLNALWVAGAESSAGAENPEPSEMQGDTQGVSHGVTHGDTRSHVPSIIPESITHKPLEEPAASSPPRPSGMVRCERCGFLVSPAALTMRCEGAHFMRTKTGKVGFGA